MSETKQTPTLEHLAELINTGRFEEFSKLAEQLMTPDNAVTAILNPDTQKYSVILQPRRTTTNS